MRNPNTDWSYLSYDLARLGIPSNVDEDVAENPTDDPWAPNDGEEIAVIRISKLNANRLAVWVRTKADESSETPTH